MSLFWKRQVYLSVVAAVIGALLGFYPNIFNAEVILEFLGIKSGLIASLYIAYAMSGSSIAQDQINARKKDFLSITPLEINLYVRRSAVSESVKWLIYLFIINGIVFLFFYGFKLSWIGAVVMYFCGHIFTFCLEISKVLFRPVRIAFFFLPFVMMPVFAIWMWLILLQ